MRHASRYSSLILLTSLFVACSTHSTGFFSDGGLDGSITGTGGEGGPSNGEGGAKDAGKKDGATAKDGAPVDEDAGDPGLDGGGSCTLDPNAQTSSPACDTCLEQTCCEDVNACFTDSDCLALLDCILACPAGDAGASCQNTCGGQHPNSINKIQLVDSCLQNCGSACQ